MVFANSLSILNLEVYFELKENWTYNSSKKLYNVAQRLTPNLQHFLSNIKFQPKLEERDTQADVRRP